MNLASSRTRARALAAARAGFAVSLVMLASSAVGVVGPAAAPAAAAPTAGVAGVIAPFEDGHATRNGLPLEDGDAATEFVLNLPVGAACTGDTEEGGYFTFGYMVAASTDPATLEFNSEGVTNPTFGDPQSAYRSPLYGIDGTPFASVPTAKAASAGQPGVIVNRPILDFATIAVPDRLAPSGDYNIGVACWRVVTAGNPTATLDRYWNAVVTLDVTAETPATTAGVTWTAPAPAAETSVTLSADPDDEAADGEEVTLTAIVDPDDAEGTITFRDGDDELDDPVEVVDGEAELTTDDLALGDHTLTAEFTPDDPAAFAPSTSDDLEYTVSQGGATTTTTSTTIRSGSSTTSTVAGQSASSTTAPRSGAGGPSTGRGAGNLALTGFSFSMAVWGVLAVVLGRMALLLGRPVRTRVG